MLLSIITINYNNAAGLEKTLQSVFSQTCRDVEYVVVDGNSTDGSRALLEKNSASISRWVSEPDTGIYNAMNKGIRLSTGKYLLFLNSGDTFENNDACRHLLDAIKDDVDILYGNLKVILPDGSTTMFIAPPQLTVDYLLKGSLFHPATVISRRLFDEYGLYSEDMKIVSDWAFFFKTIVTGNARCVHHNKTVSVFYKDGISSHPDNRQLLLKERQDYIDANFPHAVRNLLHEHGTLTEENRRQYYAFNNKKVLLKQFMKKLREDILRRLK
ncbi:glycosyltransferase family 2 protein [Ferruginibacter sp. HRS2-29]|uniref:glycosyltransferase family 2 protein n=1 Tax=Ferruginibacter sp. HRS2-29 TaxID=2487334 RepID=UPI0020CD4FB0|nr:glycosyltransferase family 2 protein [Ferruginibacter sp. HRS2-29]